MHGNVPWALLPGLRLYDFTLYADGRVVCPAAEIAELASWPRYMRKLFFALVCETTMKKPQHAAIMQHLAAVVGDEGNETPAHCREIARETQGRTVFVPIDPDLAQINAAWSTLPAAIRAAMLALVTAATPVDDRRQARSQ